MGVGIIENCNNADYDFKGSNNITYEVKANTLSHKTNNFFITYGQKTLTNTELKPACISKSKSDYHMLLYGNSFYKVKTEIIKYLLVSSNANDKISVINKRNEEIQGILLKVSVIKPYATIFNFTQ